MKNLIHKIIPLALAVAGAIGCATYKPTPPLTKPENTPIIDNEWIDLKNGFSAESYKVHDNILLLTEVYLGESILKKTENGYEKMPTYSYHTTPGEKFDKTYDEFCEAVDNRGDKFITEFETESFLNKVYDSMHGVMWIEDE